RVTSEINDLRGTCNSGDDTKREEKPCGNVDSTHGLLNEINSLPFKQQQFVNSLVDKTDEIREISRSHHPEIEGTIMIDATEKRGEIIRHLEAAMAIADELEDRPTDYFIERALDYARAQHSRLPQGFR